MARELGRPAGPWDARERPGALSASRTLLVVARHPAALAEALQDRGLPTTFAKSARAAVYWVRQQPPAMVVLDLEVERAGFLLQQFRAEGRAILAVSDDPKARTNALEAGCLDVSTSSTPIDELTLKIARAVHDRRVRRVGTIAVPPLVVDLSARQLVWHGTRIATSGVLVDLAACLASRQGQIVPSRVILEEVSGEPWASTDRVHRNIWRLRQALGLSRDSQFLVSRWREGYGMFPDQATGTGSARAFRKMDARP